MQFQDIVNKTYFLTNTNASSFPIAQLTVEANNAYERVVSLILQSDGRWQWDDNNYTDLPIATTGLVTDQQDYSLSVTHLEITRVELLDQTGNWQLLKPIDQVELFNSSLTDFMKSAGTPTYYDKLANSILLYPKPNYTQAASLKVYFKRPPSLFVVSDTTKVPGFNSLYHDLIPLWAAFNYATANGLSNASLLMNQITQKEDALKEDYALRAKDEHIRLAPRRGISFK